MPGYKCVFRSKTTRFHGEYGTALLSRLPIKQTAFYDFKSWDTHHKSNLLFGKLEQVAVAALVQLESWHSPLWFISVHLGCDASGAEQKAEVMEMNNWIDQNLLGQHNASVIVCGDFNSPGFYSAIKIMDSRYGFRNAWT